MAVTAETLRAVEALRERMRYMTDEQTRALTRAWVEAWDILLPDFEEALADLFEGAEGYITKATVARNVRLKGALQAARAHLQELGGLTDEIVTSDLPQAVYDAVDGHAAIIQSQLPPGSAGATISFTRVPDEALAVLVERTTQQIHASTQPLPADVERLMKRELVRGIAVGDNPRTVAAAMIKKAEQRFNGGLSRALNISRTEMLDAHRAATQASEKANTEILAEWEWHARLDARTCPSCLAQHGSRHKLSEQGPLDHQQGRCARVSITKSWKDLGFDIEEPKSITPNAQDWFNNLTPDTQRDILGPTRLKMLQDGDIAWSDLSVRRSTTGWRDSFNVPSIKQLAK